MRNINTVEHWSHAYRREGEYSWLTYPKCFKLIQEIKGIDLSDVAINLCKKKFPAMFSAAMIPPIPEETDSYDWIIATEFLEHFNFPDKVLAECVRVAPNAIFSVPDDMLNNQECPEHYQCFNKQSLKNLLGKYYENVKIIHFIDEFNKICLPTMLAVCEGRE